MPVSAITAVSFIVTSFAGGPAKVRDRIIVLGPHHSGTSIVAKALDGVGFYLGDAKDLLLHPDNPLKYWERRDARRLASRTLSFWRSGSTHATHSCYSPVLLTHATHPPLGQVVAINTARISSAGSAQSGGVPSFVGYGFVKTQGPPLDPSSAIAALDGSGKSWATKDPRLSLTASEWLPHLAKEHLPAPVCVLTVRHPLGFANTMLQYSTTLGLADWGSVLC